MAKKNCPQVAGGNTDPSHKSKNWCFTSFSKAPPTFDEETMKYLCFGAEICPTTKKRHWQCYVQMNKIFRLSGLKKIFGKEVHFEPARGSIAENRKYCSKEGKFVEFGTPTKQGQRMDLEKAAILAKEGKIKEIDPVLLIKFHRGIEYVRNKFTVERKRENLKVYLFHGFSGSGKSYAAHTLAEKIEKDYYKKANGPWFDGYDQQKVCVMDEFDETSARPAEILKWLDIFPLKVPIKGGFVAWNPEIIIITQVNRVEHWNIERRDGRNYYPEFRRRINEIWINGDRNETNKIITLLYFEYITRPIIDSYL